MVTWGGGGGKLRSGTWRRPADVVVEQAAIIVGQQQRGLWYGRLRAWCRGTAAEVTFDWAWGLAREERYGDVIGFYHTHPAGCPWPSERDRRTLRAWVSCLGKPLLCVIASGEKLTAYRFAATEDVGRLLPEVARFPRGVVVATDGPRFDALVSGEGDHA